MRTFGFLFVTLIVLVVYSTIARATSKQHHHEHSLFEIGLSTGIIRLIEEKETTTGIHLHISRQFFEDLPISTGIGYEYILSDHPHHAAGLLFAIMPVDEFVISIMPGITFSHEGTQFSSHFELNYNFILTDFLHIGPSIEYAYSQNDNHIALGLHFGLLFEGNHENE